MTKIADSAKKASEFANETIEAARGAAETALASGKAKAKTAYSASRTRANNAYSTAQAGVKRAGAKAGQQLDENPLAFLVGGIALGALIGSLLPRTQQEVKTLGATGRKINKAAGNAAQAAKSAGKKKLDALGISKDAAKKQAQSLLKSVSAAANEAGTAAAKAVAKPTAKPTRTAAKTAPKPATAKKTPTA